MKKHLVSFMSFVREQGVISLAIGLVLGVAVKGVVDQLVASFISPIIGMIVGNREGLEAASFTINIGDRSGLFEYGKFLSVGIQFIAVAAVIYVVVKALNVDEAAVQEMSKESAKG